LRFGLRTWVELKAPRRDIKSLDSGAQGHDKPNFINVKQISPIRKRGARGGASVLRRKNKNIFRLPSQPIPVRTGTRRARRFNFPANLLSA
jgi:hypothetical protein